MKLGRTVAALALIGTASFAPAPIHAQAENTPPSSSVPQSPSDQPAIRTAPSDAGVSFTFHQTGPTGGAQEIVPLAERVENTARTPSVDNATSNAPVEKPANK